MKWRREVLYDITDALLGKYEQGYDERDRKRAISIAMRMLKANRLSMDEFALYSVLDLEYVLELEKGLQSV